MDRKMISEGVYKRLPDVLKTVTNPFEGREKDIVLLSSLGVLSNCLPNVYGIYDRGTIYPHFYVVIVAPPASGKSSMRFSRILIEKIHTEIFNVTRAAYLDCEKSKRKPEEKGKVCPSVQVKILPANISSAEMHAYLESSKEGVVIIESEADTMSGMFKNDWSNYSTILRDAFQHENTGISRKMEKIFADISEPKLAMVISGTPDQLKPLVQSRSNGLFSRLLMYNFDEITDFKNVFDKSTKNTKQVFQSVGDEIYSLYNKMLEMQPIEFSLTEIQERRFFNRFTDIQEDIIDDFSTDFLSSLRRHGLIMFRLCMILTVIRNKDNIQEPLICSDKDYAIADSIMQTTLGHAKYTFEVLGNPFYITPQEEEVLEKLQDTFSRVEAIQAGKECNIPERTMDDRLVRWRNKKLIVKTAHGRYKKLSRKKEK